jgi:CubicO group peptidase (beta-lactamase class C family)
MKTKISILLAIMLLFQVIKLKSQVNTLQDSLLVYFPFEGDYTEKSGNNFQGSTHGVKIVGGKNKAAYFDGADDLIEIRGINALNKVQLLTVSCWINTFSKKPWSSWISKANNYHNNSQWRLSFDINPNNVEFTIFNTDWRDYIVNYLVEDKKWHHVVYLIDAANNKVTCYIDSLKIQSWDIGEINQSRGSLFMGYQCDDKAWFHGLIDEVRIYNRLLSENEIQSLYNHFKTSEKAIYEEKIETYRYSQPKKLKDGIAVAKMDAAKYDTSLISRFICDLKNKKFGGIYSFLIVKDNKLIVEEYFNDFTQDTKQYLFSATKSFTSILLGKAIELGYIKSDSDLITDYLPEAKSLDLHNGTENIRIKDLLTMTSGLADEKFIWADSVNRNNHPVFMLRNQINVNPGIQFSYMERDPHLLAHIFTNATGQTLERFAAKYLFNPMQIDSFTWHKSYCGLIEGGVGLSLTPRDFMKLGLLTINKGKWNDHQIINPEWVKISTQTHVKQTKKNLDDYGYLWWTRKFKVKDQEIGCFIAAGANGQYLLVFPTQNLVIEFTGNLYGYKKIYNQLVTDRVLPAFIN